MKAIARFLYSALFSSGSSFEQSNSRDNLIRTDKAWSKAAAEGKDVEMVISYWSDDAKIVPAGASTISGKAAIRTYVAESFATPGFKISWQTLDANVSDDGTMGYTTAVTTLIFPTSDGHQATATCRGMAVWRRDSNNEWKCIYDTWNSAT